MISVKRFRREYHKSICNDIIRISGENPGYPNFADKKNNTSVQLAWSIVNQLNCEINRESLTGQTTGGRFEEITRNYLSSVFSNLHEFRPGNWSYSTNGIISRYDQYKHLGELEKIIQENSELATTLGQDYIVKPDIVIGRKPIENDELLSAMLDIDNDIVNYSPLLAENGEFDNLILHASVSCKWTIRSDRTQNTRTEALNLIRKRKGNLPHIVAVTAEPLPTRIAALALGTGDLDCVYHFALNELKQAVKDCDNQDQEDMLMTLISGNRLRDISDLPFDLAI